MNSAQNDGLDAVGVGLGLGNQRLGKIVDALAEVILYLLVQFVVLLDGAAECAEEVGGIVEQFRCLAHGVLNLGYQFLNLRAGYRLDTADAGGDARFRNNLYHTDITGVGYMRAAA